MKNHKKLLLLSTAIATLSACRQWIAPPVSRHQLEDHQVYADSTMATSALLGIYHHLGTPTGATYVNFKYLSLYADEYQYTAANTDILQFAQSRLADNNNHNASIWSSSYSAIYQANALIQGLQADALPESYRTTVIAEARFLRAFAYFYLWQLYENIPLILSTDVQQNRAARQINPAAIIQQIREDLNYAKTNLPKTYKGNNRTRANHYAACALLARLHLYLKEWAQAESEAHTLTSQNSYELPRPEDTFLATSKEAILQFWSANGFTPDASTIVPASSTVLPSYTLSDIFYQSFESTDTRKDRWIGRNTVTTAGIPKSHYYPAKYKNRVATTTRPEHVMALRLAEQHLIRAEALAQLNRTSEAQAELNKIRQRAGANSYNSPLDQQTLINNIQKERQLELFGEWAHRLLDLKRTGKLDAALGAKPNWDGKRGQRLPIPTNELIYNPNLIQNEGY